MDYTAKGPVVALVKEVRSAGESWSCRPRMPALMKMLSKLLAVSWM